MNHLLYRMSGDTNRLHVDMGEANKQGFANYAGPLFVWICMSTSGKHLIP